MYFTFFCWRGKKKNEWSSCMFKNNVLTLLNAGLCSVTSLMSRGCSGTSFLHCCWVPSDDFLWLKGGPGLGHPTPFTNALTQADAPQPRQFANLLLGTISTWIFLGGGAIVLGFLQIVTFNHNLGNLGSIWLPKLWESLTPQRLK